MKRITKKTKIKSQKAAKQLIHKDMIFADIMQKYPEAAEIMMHRGLHCVGCGMAAYETLEQGAIMHGMNPDKLVKELNQKLAKKK